METLTPANCRKITGYDFNSILRLTGVYGAHSHFDFKKAKRFVPLYSPSYIVIEITTDLIELAVTINYKEKIIVNDVVNAFKTGQDLGLKMAENQVEEAMDKGFEEIHLFAQGGKDYPGYNGHITWAKVGFTMGKTALAKYKKLLKGLAQVYSKDLFSLYPDLLMLLSTSEGQKIWADHGFAWGGYFKLNKRSKNYKIMSKYLMLKFG
ncbi:hypothetical protein ACFQ3S_17210 [Mucilaginibacter terrae]|uniref:hypothetical protein n=1 Tax=Mucilaginibacter terrae TaxID=1955052 RepID=UPI0036288D87